MKKSHVPQPNKMLDKAVGALFDTFLKKKIAPFANTLKSTRCGSGNEAAEATGEGSAEERCLYGSAKLRQCLGAGRFK